MCCVCAVRCGRYAGCCVLCAVCVLCAAGGMLSDTPSERIPPQRGYPLRENNPSERVPPQRLLHFSRNHARTCGTFSSKGTTRTTRSTLLRSTWAFVRARTRTSTFGQMCWTTMYIIIRGMAHGPNEHVEWALQNVTDTSTADSTTHRAVSWGPYVAPRVVAAPETRIYVAL